MLHSYSGEFLKKQKTKKNLEQSGVTIRRMQIKWLCANNWYIFFKSLKDMENNEWKNKNCHGLEKTEQTRVVKHELVPELSSAEGNNTRGIWETWIKCQRRKAWAALTFGLWGPHLAKLSKKKKNVWNFLYYFFNFSLCFKLFENKK